jgi:glycosyltransferase involved in cell wall biosynthesis
MPAVSIGMPVYNCEATVAESIASILNQSFEDWELIVFDDGSQDRTLEVARGFSDPRIRIVEGGTNRGLPACLNTIIAGCSTEFFARMDGDDVAYPRRFELQLNMLREHPEIDLLGGSVLIINDAGETIGFRRAVETHRAICGTPWRFSNLVHVTWTGRMAWFRNHPYNPRLSHAQDRILLLGSRRDSLFAALPNTLAAVRENQPVWRKLISARKRLIRASIKEGLRQHDTGLLLVAPLVELGKCALDRVATATGLGHRLLRHRIPPFSLAQDEEWQNVLAAVRTTVMETAGALNGRIRRVAPASTKSALIDSARKPVTNGGLWQ